MEKAFKGQVQVFRRIEQAQSLGNAVVTPWACELTPQPTITKRAQRLERYEQVHILQQQGYCIQDIAHHLDMGERTVYTYLSHETFPEWQPFIRRRSSGLDPYKRYLLEQWQQGHPQTKQLFAAIQQQGYRGSYATVARYTRQLRQSQPQNQPSPESLNDLSGRGPAPKHQPVAPITLSARRAAWLLLQRAETLSTEEEQILEHLCQQPELTDAITLAQGFIALVRQRLPEELDDWLEQAVSVSIKAFQTFAKRLKEDYDAVKAGLTLEVSNEPVEGLNNRLKMLKRQMFGRAGLDLLARRFILTS
ncbi:MAG: transposase [Synechococcales cyanobacterium K44_A2020_017]|nr:transposase [Synechococcales cyanobacterium K32_A2020_035]MBF2096180.1 transposase [Synechococcales cyanobacterium K44_A2020_017]